MTHLSKHIFLSILLSFVFVMTFSAEQTDEEKRKDIIRYGLENEISELVVKLQSENDTSFTAELIELFNKTKSPLLRETILALFTFQKNASLKDFSLEVLTNTFDYKRTTVIAVLEYTAEMKFPEASPLIRIILESEQTDYRSKAIQTLGKLGNPEDALLLLEFMESDFSGDEKQRLITRQDVMAAISELKAVEAWDTLIAIAEDTEENIMIRASAAKAIGSLEKIEAVPVLALLYEDSDPILRTAAVQALSNFNTTEAIEIILESFKDSYYKVRLEGIAAAEKLVLLQALPYILYRAKSDPVENVKLRAFEALGILKSAEADEWLLSLFVDPKTVDKIRLKTASVLIKNNFNFIFPDLEKVIMQTLKDDKKTVLRYELGKLVAATESSLTSGIASAYLSHKDTLTRSLGLDMYSKNRYSDVKNAIENIAVDEKQGALQRRAKKLLD